MREQIQMEKTENLYGQKLAVLETLKALMSHTNNLCSSSEFAEDADMAKLEKLIAEREKNITILKQIDDQIAKAKADNIDITNKPEEQIETILGEVQKIAEQVYQLNEQGKKILTQKLKVVGNAIDKIHAGKQLTRAYGNPYQQSEGFFIDQKK